jgi:hypothetical protein
MTIVHRVNKAGEVEELTVKIGDVWKDGYKWQVKMPLGIHTTRTKREALLFAESAKVADRVSRAAGEYFRRQSRKVHPDGRLDKGGRWYPSASERQACCNQIRQPSRSYPWGLMLHCRTMVHLAQAYDVPEADLRSRCR